MATTQRSLYPWLMKDYLAIASDVVNDRLHHALLLHGASGLGIEQLVERVVELNHCSDPIDHKACGQCQNCLLHQSHSHADFYLVECLDGKAQISIEQIRLLSKKIQGTGLVNQKRIVVIQSIELMTESATNALLKILEEPPSHVYFMLTTTKIQNIKPTIISRCFKVVITQPDLQKTQAWLNKKTGTQVDINQLSLLGGTPLNALNAINSGFSSQLNDYINCLNQLYVSWAKKQLDESFCHGLTLVELFEKIEKDKLLDNGVNGLIDITQRFNQHVLKQQLRVTQNSAVNMVSASLRDSLSGIEHTTLLDFSDRLATLKRLSSQNSGVSLSMQLQRSINVITQTFTH